MIYPLLGCVKWIIAEGWCVLREVGRRPELGRRPRSKLPSAGVALT